jgi:hypothetical protein
MPTKEQIRQWMQQRTAEHKPPPTPAQVREQLGWHLVNRAPEVAR